MPVSVPLDFIPPGEPNIVALRIYEGVTKDGPFIQIERTTNVGVAPNYITRYTTNLATAIADWFTIQWEDSGGALSPMSQAIQGGTTTLVHRIIDRVLVRDSSLNERIVSQEAEGVIQTYYGDTVDPYNPTLKPNYRILSGLTLLTLARSKLQSIAASGNVSGWTAGLVSMKSGTAASSLKDIQALIAEAGTMLGMRYSMVAQMAVPEIVRGLSQVVTADISRLLIEVE